MGREDERMFDVHGCGCVLSRRVNKRERKTDFCVLCPPQRSTVGSHE